VTSFFTAAAITGQGALATLNQVDLGDPGHRHGQARRLRQQGAGHALDLAPSARPGVNDIWVKLVGSAEQGIYAWNGSAWVLGSDITGLFTAAASPARGRWRPSTRSPGRRRSPARASRTTSPTRCW
jgi:hypothetical protein